MDVDRNLTDQERKFLSRAARRRILFLLSSIVTVVVAVTILVYHGLIMKDMNGPRFVITLLLLLSGRSYLRLYKSATIFSKLQPEPATK
jgi:ribose/xylose/arabinose/galactoside ABC-type transport system permease subunit